MSMETGTRWTKEQLKLAFNLGGGLVLNRSLAGGH